MSVQSYINLSHLTYSLLCKKKKEITKTKLNLTSPLFTS